MLKEPDEYGIEKDNYLTVGGTFDTDRDLEITLGHTTNYLKPDEVSGLIKHLCKVMNFHRQEEQL